MDVTLPGLVARARGRRFDDVHRRMQRLVADRIVDQLDGVRMLLRAERERRGALERWTAAGTPRRRETDRAA